MAISAAPTVKIALSTAISAASEECCGRVAPTPVSPMTASPAAVIVDAEPCRRPRRKPKKRLGEDGEEHQPAGEHRLHDRQRRARERPGVQHPGEDRDQPPDREPLGAKQRRGTAQRMPNPDRRHEDRAPLLEQERHVRGQSRREREQQSQDHQNERPVAESVVGTGTNMPCDSARRFAKMGP